MIHRLQRGQVPDKPHTAFYVDGSLVFEHCFTRQGFEGAFTIMYHRWPPHWIEAQEDLGPHPGWSEPGWTGALRRRHFRTAAVEQGGSPFMARRLLMASKEVGAWISRPGEDDPTLVANADGDDLTFVFQGRGRVESPLGALPFQADDYVFVPRALPHRWRLEEPGYLLDLEGRSYVDVPGQFRNTAGQLLMDAPYTHRDFTEPQWPDGGPAVLDAPRTLIIQRHGRLTRVQLSHDPFDIVGWDGQVWPFAFPIRSFQPKTGLVHLPPTIHTTFAGGGFVVCSFVPRLVDFHDQAIPCPYPHSSVSCDEMIFYVEGSFTSRRGIDAGSMTLHPVGVPHGPHPGRYEGSIGTTRTDELAVMVDTFAPLLPTAHAAAIEQEDCNQSWVQGEDGGVME